MPKSFSAFTCSRAVPFIVYTCRGLPGPICNDLHFVALKGSSHFSDHALRFVMSCCNRSRSVVWVCRSIKLCVICEQHDLTFNTGRQIIYIHKEQCRTKHGSLRNAASHWRPVRLCSVHSNSLFSSHQECFDPGQNISSDSHITQLLK